MICFMDRQVFNTTLPGTNQGTHNGQEDNSGGILACRTPVLSDRGSTGSGKAPAIDPLFASHESKLRAASQKFRIPALQNQWNSCSVWNQVSPQTQDALQSMTGEKRDSWSKFLLVAHLQQVYIGAALTRIFAEFWKHILALNQSPSSVNGYFTSKRWIKGQSCVQL